jgi:hypothetical protein
MVFSPIAKCLTTHLSNPLDSINGASHALIAKTKNNQSQGPEATFYILASSLGTHGRVGA